jgi:hypothetical protein
VQASKLHRDPLQDEIEEELIRDKNTSLSKGGRPISSTLSKGVSDAQYECGFGISSHISHTSNVRIEGVKAEVRALNEKFNTMQMKMQSSFDAVMAKFGIMVEGMTTAPSRGENPSNVDKGRLNSRRSVSSIAHSMSKEHVSKLLDVGSAGEKSIVVNTEIPRRSQKASSCMKILNRYEIWNDQFGKYGILQPLCTLRKCIDF